MESVGPAAAVEEGMLRRQVLLYKLCCRGCLIICHSVHRNAPTKR